jgi:CBS domain-containing protein
MKQPDHAHAPDLPDAEPKARPRIVERMLSGFGHPDDLRPAQARPAPGTQYQPLRQRRPAAGEAFYLQRQETVARVQADSPATDVMTDLTRVAAVAIRSLASLEEAHRTMIASGVRALFVVDDQPTILGIITSTDLMGERPVQVAHQRGVRYDEVMVRQVMTPADRIEAMELDDVLRARVGDIVASLRHSGRQHALVIGSAPGASGAARTVRGIFSLTQIARQLGLPPNPAHDVARTFAEIEAAIAA